ncbi:MULTISPECIES: DUF1853 family protein [unclassified Vibrio]|uniref:DUF1853 family protein n=1 Tax=unclassified Vibrio TaxID=2614977 RepID=UPI00148272B7|nr:MULTISPECIES: DUF1853 family protein [unclassified Vibrio]NNN43280.1 DUF1853 family protein [Vibrio sp. 1-1(7)]NNN71104.1 DUF1853 family protein [Vibrio sp. 12-2(3-a)]
MDITPLINWVIKTPTLFEASCPLVAKVPFTPPAPEQRWPNYQGNPRLGFVYQFICQQLFTRTPRYNAVSEEIQLNEDGKTLGAIDFITKNRHTDAYEHWEVAIKFYLLHQGLWYGPNAEDRLDIKLAHMLNHQLSLSTRLEFCQTYPLWANAQPHLLMQGRLYTNPFQAEPIPKECLGYSLNCSQIQGHWCYQDQVSLIDEPLYSLDKPQWLTGREKTSPTDFAEQHYEEFVHCQSESGIFWFIMPRHWPASAKFNHPK